MSRAAERAGGLVRRILAEPLTQFLIIGLVIFLAAATLKRAERPVLRLDSQELGQLAAYWEAQTQRPPTKAELDGLIRERIDEEILAQEARRLGLDQGDMIIRRRLAQKMAFASEDTAVGPEPTEAQLQGFYAAHQADYRSPAHVALRHVFFSEDRTTGDPQQAAAAALATLKQGHSAPGDPSVLPLSYADVSLDDLSRDYGQGFAGAVATAAPGTWQGPVKSAYGWHLVRVEARHPAAVAPFDQVRTEVRDAYLADRRHAANEAYLAKLRKRYRITIAGPAS
jgi:peptidyl-prolyl cis-trans isomerase C